jgi:hypothetical protein
MYKNEVLSEDEIKITKKCYEQWLKRIRNFAGFLGMVLPWIALIGAIIVAKAQPENIPSDFWKTLSISATYYWTPAMAGVLTTAAIVLMCYKGYDWKDELITTISGIFGLMIVLFPCDCSSASGSVGFFQLPVGISDKIHCTAAVLFFLLLAINSIFLFTLGESNTRQKRIRNLIYKICGIGMFSTLFLLIMPFNFNAKIFVVETIALTFFGISWLVKGQFFGFLSDKPADYIAYCGINCMDCKARIATLNDDNELRKKVAKEWSELNGVEITPEMINCDGCRIDGVKTVYCESMCPIRKCAMEKGYKTCGYCDNMKTCENLSKITKNNKKARRNLKYKINEDL